ncbi:MAG: sensor histidine kinase [Bdellovibrionota bacterium]
MNFAAKLLLGSVSVLLVASTADTLYSNRISQRALREEFAAHSEEQAATIASLLSPLGQKRGEVCRIADEIYKIHALRYLTVSLGSTVWCTFGQRPLVKFDLSVPETSRREMEQTRVYTTYASVDCGKTGCKPLELEVGFSFSQLDASLKMLWQNQVQTSLALVLGAAVFLAIFSALVRRRLEKLATACARIQSGELKLELDLGGGDEIARVAEAMKKMARELTLAAEEKDRQRQTLLQSSKMSALGEMAGGMAHEINSPLATIKMKTAQLEEVLQEEPMNKSLAVGMASSISKMADRISKIVISLRTFSREGSNDPFMPVPMSKLVEETIVLCKDRFQHHDIELNVEIPDPELSIESRGVQISQVLLNLLNNAHDAVMQLPEGKKWVRLSISESGEFVEIRVTDCMGGIPPDVQKKMFQPFFTTKAVGSGTGMGLSISIGIVRAHGGELIYDAQCPNTSFVIKLPKKQTRLNSGAA